MSALISIRQRPTDGVVILDYNDGRYSDAIYSGTAMWTRTKLRKHTKCAVTSVPLKPGDQAYRPLGNMAYRSRRIAAFVIDGEAE